MQITSIELRIIFYFLEALNQSKGIDFQKKQKLSTEPDVINKQLYISKPASESEIENQAFVEKRIKKKWAIYAHAERDFRGRRLKNE